MRFSYSCDRPRRARVRDAIPHVAEPKRPRRQSGVPPRLHHQPPTGPPERAGGCWSTLCDEALHGYLPQGVQDIPRVRDRRSTGRAPTRSAVITGDDHVCLIGTRFALCRGGQPALEIRRAERTLFRDQGSGRVHLPPRVPQQHAAHPLTLKVIDDAGAVRLLPVLHRLQPGIEHAHRLIAEVE